MVRGINDRLEKLMVALVLVAVPIAIVNDVFQLAALAFVQGGDSLAALSPEQRSALALGFLNVHRDGVSVVELFWGLWLFPFGALVIQSRFIPKLLGVLLFGSGCAYVIESCGVLLWPEQRELLAKVLSPPMALGEVLMVLWLLIKGTRESGAQVFAPSIVEQSE